MGNQLSEILQKKNKESNLNIKTQKVDINNIIEIKNVLKNIDLNENSNYLLKHDENAQDRLNEQHWMIEHLFENRNYYSPVKEYLEKGCHVLDSGCGSGIWSLIMSKTYNNSLFIGIDNNDKKYPNEIKPVNCVFRFSDITNNICYDNDYFYFIHQRLLAAGIKKEEWLPLIQELKRVCKTGGWIEFVEMDLYPKDPGNYYKSIHHDFINILKIIGFNTEIATDLKNYLEISGFINIHVEKKKIYPNYENPVNEIFYNDLKNLFYESKNVLKKVLNNTDEDYIIDVIDKILKECVKNNTYFEWYRIYAQKP